MNSKLTPRERAHLERVKSLPCGLTGAAQPSEAHHIIQGLHYLCIPLSKDAHTNQKLGIHGEKILWKIHKMTEWDVLNETIRKLYG